MPYRANYPATVAEVLDDRLTFRPAALAAVRQLARAKPWRGDLPRRLGLLRRCALDLADAYGVRPPAVEPGRVDSYIPAFNTIYTTRGSVVSFLHEFAHARGFDERQACRWSINLFRRCFPRSYARCRHDRHLLVRNPNPERTA